MFKNWFRSGKERPDPVVHGEEGAALHQLAGSSAFLLRQPVLDRTQKIIGYDVAFRRPDNDPGSDQVLDELQEDTLAKLEQLEFSHNSPEKLMFVRLKAGLLASVGQTFATSNRLVLVLDSWHQMDQETLLRDCQACVGSGWQLAIDNLPEQLESGQLLPLLSWLRFDLRRYSAVDLEQQLRQLRHHASLRLLARQVETEDDFEASQALGFDACQGYFFTRVRLNQQRRIDHDRIRVMRLLNLLAQNVELKELESVMRRDAILSYKLLMYINSPLNGLDHPLESISQALMFLGYGPLYRWLTVLLFTSGTRHARDRAILQQALVRARLMELLAGHAGMGREAESLFLTGMISMLDALLNVPIDQAIEPLMLSDPITQALTQRSGPYSPYLDLALALETGDWYQADDRSRAIGLNADAINPLLVEAMGWASALDSLPAD